MGAGDTLPTVEQERGWIAKMNADGCHQVMATPDDAQPMLDYMRGSIDQVTRFIMTTPEEFTYTLEEEREMIAGVNPAAGEFWPERRMNPGRRLARRTFSDVCTPRR